MDRFPGHAPGFCYTVLPHRTRQALCPPSWTCSTRQPHQNRQSAISRRTLLAGLGAAAFQLGAAAFLPEQSLAAPDDQKPLTGFLTRSGLKYFDFARGSGPSPQWGELVNIQYVSYTISPDGNALQKHDSSYDRGDAGYTIHHGNGEQIAGLEEAVHSMSVGGRRRAIMPQNIAYSRSNLGPVPPAHEQRKRFSEALSAGDGTVVMDIEVKRIMEDKGDRGYYTDLTPTEEEMLEMMTADGGSDIGLQ